MRTRLIVALAVIMTSGLLIAGPSAGAGAPVVAPVVLPRDHGAHPGFGVEWWYTAGTVTTPAGRPYFWFATVWSAAPGMVARVNVVDLRADRVVLAREYASLTPPRPGQTHLAVGPFALALRAPRWTVRAPVSRGSLTLTLTPTQPYVRHGRDGVIEQGPGGPSAYYSAPRLAARGRLSIGGTSTPVTGLGWLDHQWGNFIADPGALRWNWFACQLSGGRDLMLYEFLGTGDRPSGQMAGTFVASEGRVVHLSRFGVSALAPYVHPAGSAHRFPLRWRLRVPAAGLQLTLRSRARHQFIANRLVPSFWEGAAAITAGAAGACIVESSRVG